MLWLLTPLVSGLAALLVPDGWLRRYLAPLVLFALLSSPHESLSARMGVVTLGLLYALKGWVLLRLPRADVRSSSRLGLFLYLSLWPGMDPRSLLKRSREISLPGRWFLQGWVTMIVGAVFFLSVVIFKLPSWLGLAALLTTIHLGYADVLSALMRWAGFPVRRLFNQPLLSRTLREFWGVRWNIAFVEMNKVLFVPMLARGLGRQLAIPAAFLVSGLLHDLALSYPAGAGWGLPLLYFFLQACLVQAERPMGISRWPGWMARLWTWTALLLPLPLLFHGPVRTQLVAPLLAWFGSVPWLASFPAFLDTLVWLAGPGHFLILGASFQVPQRLGWHTELPRLRPFNRKLMWVYGGFVVLNILSFGALTLGLHAELMRGDRAAMGLAAFIGLYWWARLGVDAVVYENSDWPEGPEFIVGHTLLNSLFVFLAMTYTLLLVAVKAGLLV